jgi:hypothetical protein
VAAGTGPELESLTEARQRRRPREEEPMAKKIGVVLSGCGVYDGAEIHESVLTLLSLDRRGAEAVLCAPDAPQMHVVNHLSGQVDLSSQTSFGLGLSVGN